MVTCFTSLFSFLTFIIVNNYTLKIWWLLRQPNCLHYNKAELLAKYVEGVSEVTAIALELCGTSGEELATDFMEGKDVIDKFLENVSFNGERSNPLILRAINIRESL